MGDVYNDDLSQITRYVVYKGKCSKINLKVIKRNELVNGCDEHYYKHEVSETCCEIPGDVQFVDVVDKFYVKGKK